MISKMSDSDNDNVLTFQNEGSIISANGPNINVQNLAGLRFRNNDLTSKMNMPSSMSISSEYQKRPWSNYSQRSLGLGCRRETSPMSVASACDMRLKNYNRSFYSQAQSSHRLNSERARSPTMSLKSIDSYASVVDIVSIINNFHGSKYEENMLNEACKNRLRHKRRRRIEKRRKLKVFLPGYRRRSGNDSGDLGSNSSISSDDNRSTKTAITDIRRNIIHSNMVKDCTNNFQNKMLSMINKPTNLNSTRSSVKSFKTMMDKPTIPKPLPPPVSNSNKIHSQKFKNGFFLPSQRFDQSLAATSIPETASGHPVPIINTTNSNNPQEIVSDDEEIFSELTSSEKPENNSKKRGIDRTDDIYLPNNKKSKVDIVQKDFEFLKPACPFRKVASVKPKERLISASTENFISKPASLPPIQNNSEHEDDTEDNNEVHKSSQNNTEVSMRQSFMKRKLFSQTMDVTEKVNDTANSPQNSVYGKIQKEKNKARKLVTSQYCLSRDINSDENNLLDLIHKIVPAEQMNATAQPNKTISQNINKSEDKDNWDISSIISQRNNEEDLSDTFTDEDASIVCNKKGSSPKTVKKVCDSPLKNIQKSPFKVSMMSEKVLAHENGAASKRLQHYIKSFWDTDYESEVEFTPASRKEIEKAFKENKNTDATPSVAHKPKLQGFWNKNPLNNSTMMNTTVDSMKTFSNSIFKLCSHRNSKPMNIGCENINKSTKQIKSLSTNPRTNEANTRQVTEPENDTQPTNKKPNKPKQPVKIGCKKANKSTTELISSLKHKTTKAITRLEDTVLENDAQNKTPDKSKQQKPVKKKSPPKKQSKAKTVINNITDATTNAAEKENNLTNKTLGDENTKPQKQKNKNIQSKTESEDILDPAQDGGPKIGATESLNKIGNSKNKTIQTKNDTKPQNLVKENPQIKNASKSQKSDLNIKDKTINNNKGNSKKNNRTKLSESLIYEDPITETNNNNRRLIRSCQNASKDNTSLNITLRSTQKNAEEIKPPPKRSKSKEQPNLSNISFIKKTNRTKLSDSLIYEDSITETNNNSIRPIRSCRLSKQNASKVNTSLNITLRSRQKKTEEKEPPPKRSKSKEQSNLSDLSFFLPQQKSISSIKSRLRDAKNLDYTESDISFTLTIDKDSPLKSRGKSTKFINQRNNEFLSKERRPIRRRTQNKRYVS